MFCQLVVAVLVSLKADYWHSKGLVNSDGLLWSACSGYSGTCIITHRLVIKINVWSIHIYLMYMYTLLVRDLLIWSLTGKTVRYAYCVRWLLLYQWCIITFDWWYVVFIIIRNQVWFVKARGYTELLATIQNDFSKLCLVSLFLYWPLQLNGTCTHTCSL